MKKVLAVLAVLALLATMTASCTSLVPLIYTFDVSPNPISTGGSSNLLWNVAGVSSVTITPGPGQAPAVGSVTVNPTVTTAYTITASNTFGTVSKSVILTVNPLPITINVTANPAVLQSGNSASLQWSISGADGASIDQGIGEIPLIGNRAVSPTETTTYTISARNAGGTVNKSVTITVNPTINANFDVNPSTISVGRSAVLTWNVTGADTVTIDQGIGQVPASGSRTVSPYSTTSYTLTASNSCCVLSKAVIVTVGTIYPYGPYNNNPYFNQYGFPYYGGGNVSLTPFIEIFTASPSVVHVGQPTLLRWSVYGASSITITGIGNVAPNGARLIVPTTTSTYVLTATNAYSSTTANVTIQVVP
jgi:hypothetical protein